MWRRWGFAILLVGAGISGAVLVSLLNLLGLVLWVVIGVVAAAVARRITIARYPEHSRRELLARLDPEAGPPAGAQPVRSDLLARLYDAAAANDWADVRRMLDDEFRLIDAAGQVFDAREYVRWLRRWRRMYPDLRSHTEAVVAEPEHPSVLWVRVTMTGHPRRGPDLDGTTWSRATITPDGERVREVAHVGVIRVG